MKKLLIIVFIFLASIVLATHTTIITVTPDLSYETTNLSLNISITNNGPKQIINTTIFFNNYTLISIPDSTEYIDYTNTSDTIICSTFFNPGSTQNFGSFIFQTPLTDENTTYNWIIETTDDKEDTFNNIIQITSLNDYTPPIFSNLLPENASFNLGSVSELFSIDASDEETGVKNATLNYCNNESIQECNSLISAELDCIENICNITQDLSIYQDSSYINYKFDIANNANEINSSEWYYIQLDKIPPSIILESPADNIEFNQNESLTFTFKAADNLASYLDCSFIINDVIIDTKIIANDTSDNFTYIITEAKNWNINCTDETGLTSQSETRSFSIYSPSPPAADTSGGSSGGGGGSTKFTRPVEKTPVIEKTEIKQEKIETPVREQEQEKIIPQIESKKTALQKFTGFVNYNVRKQGVNIILLIILISLAGLLVIRLKRYPKQLGLDIKFKREGKQVKIRI